MGRDGAELRQQIGDQGGWDSGVGGYSWGGGGISRRGKIYPLYKENYEFANKNCNQYNWVKEEGGFALLTENEQFHRIICICTVPYSVQRTTIIFKTSTGS